MIANDSWNYHRLSSTIMTVWTGLRRETISYVYNCFREAKYAVESLVVWQGLETFYFEILLVCLPRSSVCSDVVSIVKAKTIVTIVTKKERTTMAAITYSTFCWTITIAILGACTLFPITGAVHILDCIRNCTIQAVVYIVIAVFLGSSEGFHLEPNVIFSNNSRHSFWNVTGTSLPQLHWRVPGNVTWSSLTLI